MRHILLTSALLVACGDAPGMEDVSLPRDESFLLICAGTDDEVALNDFDSERGPGEPFADHAIDGVVTAVGDAPPGEWNLAEPWAPCTRFRDGRLVDAISQVVTIEVEDGTRWWLGWTIEDEGTDLSPQPALGVGDSIRVGWYMDAFSGLDLRIATIHDESGLVLALRSTYGGDAPSPDGNDFEFPMLSAEALGFAVDQGDPVGTADGDCGLREWRALAFAGDTGAELVPGDADLLIVGEDELQLRVVDNYHWLDARCADVRDRMLWGAWR